MRAHFIESAPEKFQESRPRRNLPKICARRKVFTPWSFVWMMCPLEATSERRLPVLQNRGKADSGKAGSRRRRSVCIRGHKSTSADAYLDLPEETLRFAGESDSRGPGGTRKNRAGGGKTCARKKTGQRLPHSGEHRQRRGANRFSSAHALAGRKS